ncbi:MAG: Fusaric acid resistance protein [Friedmanniella sp.]|nr:Fusaric acid resistance protein [Friedmanniella sp.]
MPVSRAAPSRQVLAFGPHAGSHWPALRVVASVVVPLALLTALHRQDLALFAVFGAFGSLYGRGESHRQRVRTQVAVGLCFLVVITAAAAVATAGDVRPWLAVGLASTVAGAGSVASDVLRWRPPGPLFLVFCSGAIAAVPAPAGGGPAHVATAAGVALTAAVFAVAVGGVGALHPRTRSLHPAAPLGAAATLARPGVWRHAARYLVAAAVAGTLATLLHLGHPYWATLTAVVPMAAPDTGSRLVRALHRVVGTGAGLLVAAGVLALHPRGWTLVALVAAAQFGAELLVLRNYALALVCITPLALLMTTLGGAPDVPQLLWDRAVETLLGISVGVVATLAWSERERSDLTGTGSG